MRAGWQIGVKVVLPAEAADDVGMRVQAKAGAPGLFSTDFVDDRQHARKGGTGDADLAVRFGPEGDGRTAEQLGVRDDLGVDFQPTQDFPRSGAALQ